MNPVKSSLISLLVLSAALPLFAELKIHEKGDFEIGGLSARIKCFDNQWRGCTQAERHFIVRKKAENSLVSEIDMPELKGTLRQRISETGKGAWRYTAEVELAKGFSAPQVALDMTMPAVEFGGTEILVDGEKFEFPVNVLPIQDPFNLLWKKSNTVVFPMKRAQVAFSSETPFDFLVQDDRAFGGDTFAVRIVMPKTGGNSYVITLELKEKAYTISPLDLRMAFNTNFEDEYPDDRKGGWTDQGADNDLRMFPCREKLPRIGDVPFALVAPEKNGNRSCIVLRGPFRDYFPQSAEAVQTAPCRGNYLYILHALAWPSSGKVGDITLEYTDGTRAVIAVTGMKDVGNWWSPQPYLNGAIAWNSENKAAVVGLYRSVYPVENKPVGKIAFSSTGSSVWAIVAATLSSDRIPERKLGGPVSIEKGTDWQPIRLEKDVVSGSVLDFSGTLDAPAGKYGPVVVRNGQFEFRDRPGMQVRFYGTNLVDTAQFMEHEWSERLADRMAEAGFNLVRIHHHDNGLSVRKDGASTELNEKNLDRLNYLIACFKKRGIYVITDCYASRRFTEEELEAWGAGEFKHLVFLKKSAMENWKRFVKNWFTAKNPYTGLALGDDPVLIGVNLINEGFLGGRWDGPMGEIKQAQFRKWLNGKGWEDEPKKHEELTAAWLLETYERSYREMYGYLRNELSMKVPISDQNHRSEWLLSFLRDRYDYVDNHYYFDHPQFPMKEWTLPAQLENVSSLENAAADLTWMFHTRIYGKPLAVTEFDYAKPNFFRAEGGVLPAAYGSLQDWSGLVQFAYSHGGYNIKEDQTTGGPFDLASDVVKMLSHRIGVKLFRGREIKPSPVVLAAALSGPEKMNFSLVPSRDLRNLGLVARLGTVVLPNGTADREKLSSKLGALLNTGFNFPEGKWDVPVVEAKNYGNDPWGELMRQGILPRNSRDASGKIFRSPGGQLELDTAKQTFRATASGIEVLILPAGNRAEVKHLRVDNQIGRGVFSLQSVDGKTLEESDRMLFLHLTDSQATRLKFDNGLLKQYSSYGQAPHLAARGEADVRIAQKGDFTLYSCDTAGKRLAKVPLSKEPDGTIRFQAKVFRPEGSVFVYELVRK